MVRGHWWQAVSKLLDQAAGRRSVSGRRTAGHRPRGSLYLEALERRLAPAAAAITLTISNPMPFPEGDFGTSDMMFVVTRSGDTAPAVQVDFATQDGTAHAGTDYTATSGTLSFGPGDTTETISVPIIGNTILQSDRSFTVSLSNPLASAAFGAQETFATGGGSFSAAVADFNGDGKLDLVVANRDSNTVSVLLNTTAAGANTPSFAAQETFATGSGPESVAMADFNGDGKPDLVVANENSNTVSVLLNTTSPGATTPSFAAQQTFGTGSFPQSLTVGDLNGDGKPDLVVGNFSSGSVSVLLNTTAAGATTPSFAAQQTFAAGTNPEALAVADLNGDGKADLVVANQGSNNVSVLLNTTAAGATTPSFLAQQTFAAGSRPHSVALADLNGDGKPDLVVANFDAAVSVLLNTTAPGASTASFTAQETFAAGSFLGSLALTDFNGDGKLDLVVSNETSGTASVLLNTTAAGASTPSFAAQETFAIGGLPVGVAVADFNGDGNPDLAVTNDSPNAVSVLLNARVPITIVASFSTQETFATGMFPMSLALGDFNGDGKSDLVVANNGESTASVLLNTAVPGATTPSFAAQQTFATGGTPSSVAVADVNGDGKPDLVLANEFSGAVSVLLNMTAPGATTLSFAAPQTFAAGSDPFSVAAADLNGDGRPDLVVANHGDNTVSVLLNTTAPGATIPSFATQKTFATGSIPVCVAVADLNGDGKPDLVVANQHDNTLSVLLNTTAPGSTALGFAAQKTFGTGGTPTFVGVSDLNGDGKPDVIVTNEGDNTVSVLVNTTAAGATSPSFANQATFASGGGPFSVAVADLNGDGKPDLVLSNDFDDTASVLLNITATGSSTPSFAPRETFATGNGPFSVAVADLNGDGKLDLVVGNFDSSTASVLLNNVVPFALDGSPATGTIQDDDAPVTMTIAAGNNQSATVNTAFMTNLVVDVRNAAGNLVQGVSVTFTAPASGPSGTFAGSATVLTDASGEATAPTFTANTTAGGYTVTASTTEGSQPSVSFNLTNLADVATHFSVSAPSSATAGTALSFMVTALDQFENTATDYTGTVHFTSSDGSAALPADSTLTSGTGTFSATLKTAGSQTVTATDTGNSSITGTSDAIDVSAAEATHFFVSTPPSASAGTAFDFTVTALDQFENTATGYTGTVHFTSSDGSAALPADSTLTSGTGTFSATLKTAGSQTITATDTGNSSITGTSNTIDVSAAAATHFLVSAPASATAGTAFDFTVTAMDQFDNTATDYTGTVHFTSSDGSPVLPADSMLTNGTGTFSATLKTAGSQTITATDTGNSSITGTSNTIDVSAAAATHFLVTAPAGGTAGTAFDFTVTALDQFENTATGYGGTVHFTSSDGSAVLPADSMLTSGTGTFSATLDSLGGQTITATDTGNSSITGTSNPIAVGFALAVGADAGGSPEVKVYDASGTELASFLAFDPAFPGGVRVAAGDVNGDGVQDLIVAAGPGGGPHVKIIDGTKLAMVDSNNEIEDTALLGQFYAYSPLFTGGVFVAFGVSNGLPQIITGAGAGGGPHVKVIDGAEINTLQNNSEISDSALVAQFYAYSPFFTGGVRVAAADLNADGVLDMVTGAGPGGGPHVKAIDGTKLGQLQNNAEISDAALIGQFYAYTPTVAPGGGVYVAATDIGGHPIITTGDGPLSLGSVDGPRVKVIDATKLNLLDSNGEPTGAALLGNFFAYDPAFGGGVSVGAADLNGGGVADIVSGPGPGGGANVKVVDGTQLDNLQPNGEIAGAALLDSFFAFDATFAGGVFVGAGA
jgi:hypothetical protein